MYFLRLDMNGFRQTPYEFELLSFLENVSYLAIPFTIIFLLSIYYERISKKESSSIENDDFGTPIYQDLDILLQEKPQFYHSPEFIPEVPLKTKTSLFTKISVTIISILLIFNYLNSILQYY